MVKKGLDKLFDGDEAIKEENHFNGWNRRRQYSVQFVKDVRERISREREIDKDDSK